MAGRLEGGGVTVNSLRHTQVPPRVRNQRESGEMTGAVILKPVRRTDVPLRLEPARPALHPDETTLVANGADRSALAMALSLRSSGASKPEKLIVVTVGPPAWEESLRDALAYGADEAWRVWPEGWLDEEPMLEDGSAGHTRRVALAGAAALAPLAPALALTGERSADSGQESFGAFLAHALGAAFAHRVVEAAPQPGGWRVRVKLERGYSQEMTVESPAVMTVAAQGGHPAYPSLPAWLRSRTAPLTRVAPAVDSAADGTATALRPPLPRVKRYRVPEASLGAEARIRAMVSLPAAGGGTVLPVELEPDEQARELARFLKERGYG